MSLLLVDKFLFVLVVFYGACHYVGTVNFTHTKNDYINFPCPGQKSS